MKAAAAIIVLLMLCAVAMAQINFAPMVPQAYPPVANPLSPMVPGMGMPMVPNSNAGGSGPPTCSNSLDFTQACNSQYIAIGIF